MPLKETPLVDATARSGPLPNLLTANDDVTGATAVTSTAAFAGLAMMFPASIVATGDTSTVLQAARLGGRFGIGFALLVMIGAYALAFDDDDQAATIKRCLRGGFVAGVLLLAIDLLALDILQNALRNIPLVAGN